MTYSEGSLFRALLPVLVGGLVVFSATTLYTDLWKKPEVVLLYSEFHGIPQYRDSLKFTNVGRIPADNLRITIVSIDVFNTVNFTLGAHSQNTTLKLEEGTWIAETRKFPVGGEITVHPILKNLSKVAVYSIDVASDQGVKGGTLVVNPVNNTIKTDLIPPQSVPINIAPAIIGLVAALVIAFLYVLARKRENSRIRRYDDYLKKVNNEMYQFYAGRVENKNSHLTSLDTLRGEIRSAFAKGRIKRSDFEALENKILEHVEKMNKNSSS